MASVIWNIRRQYPAKHMRLTDDKCDMDDSFSIFYSAYLQRNKHYYARSCFARIIRIEKVTKLTIYSFGLYIIIFDDFTFYHGANNRCKNLQKNITIVTHSVYNITEIVEFLRWWWKTTVSTFRNIYGTLNTTYNARLPKTICLDIDVDYDSSFRILMLDLPFTSKTKEFFSKKCVYMWSRYRF